MALRFSVNGETVEVDGVAPTMTLLQWLRATGRVATKEGCAEGDCGACTVAVLDEDGAAPTAASWRAVNSCLVLLPSVDGRRIVTAEGLAEPDGTLHPAQTEMVDRLGSQCGYCTPGFVMSLFEACYREDLDAPWKLDDQLCGNLCRCTGYRPIRDAAAAVGGTRPDDRFSRALALHPTTPRAFEYRSGEQRYTRPNSLDALWTAIDGAPDARFVCGATDLGLSVTKRHVAFAELIGLDAVAELRGMSSAEGGIRIGAAVRLSELEAWSRERLPVVARMLRFFASRQIKNRATVGGNLCNASPIGDLAPVFMALDATMVLQSRGEERRVSIDEFFTGYRQTALRAGEILKAVEVAPMPSGTDIRLGAYKVSKRRELDISAVCGGFRVVVGADGVVLAARLAFGGMAATTARASTVEAALVGRPWTRDGVEAASARVGDDFTPLDDLRGSAWYRTTVARNLIRGFFEETADGAQPRLPDHPAGTLVLGSAR